MHETISLPRGQTGLLLIDLQEEHRRDSRYLAAGFDAALANASRLLGSARAQGVPVFHAEFVRDFSKVPPRRFELTGRKGEPAFSDAASDLVAICGEVAPLAGEKLFTKNDPSAFACTELRDALAARGIEWLVVAGAWTEACVAASVRDAVDSGFRVLLVKDACASGTAMMHKTAILNLANRLLGGGVATTYAAETLIAGAAARVWRLEAMVPFRFDAHNLDELYDSL